MGKSINKYVNKDDYVFLDQKTFSKKYKLKVIFNNLLNIEKTYRSERDANNEYNCIVGILENANKNKKIIEDSKIVLSAPMAVRIYYFEDSMEISLCVQESSKGSFYSVRINNYGNRTGKVFYVSVSKCYAMEVMEALISLIEVKYNKSNPINISRVYTDPRLKSSIEVELQAMGLRKPKPDTVKLDFGEISLIKLNKTHYTVNIILDFFSESHTLSNYEDAKIFYDKQVEYWKGIEEFKVVKDTNIEQYSPIKCKSNENINIEINSMRNGNKTVIAIIVDSISNSKEKTMLYFPYMFEAEDCYNLIVKNRNKRKVKKRDMSTAIILKEEKLDIGTVGLWALRDIHKGVFLFEVYIFFTTPKDSIRHTIEKDIEDFTYAYNLFYDTYNDINNIELENIKKEEE